MLSGLGGNDIYVGGAGNDTLTDNSATSNDVYRWGIGQGNDTVRDAGGSDRIEIAAGVTANQVTLTRSGNNLLVGISGAPDVLTVATGMSARPTRSKKFAWLTVRRSVRAWRHCCLPT